MSQRRRGQWTEITAEHHEIVILRLPCDPARRWCKDCATEVEMVVAEQGARLAGITTRTMYRWMDMAKVHYLEGQDGAVLVCAPSILKLAKGSVAKPSTQSICGPTP